MLGTKYKNYKEIFKNLQECVLQYALVKYKKGLDIAPLIMKLEDVDISSKEPISPTGTGTRSPTEITKKRYELELEKLG